jgi:MFS family permease
VVHTMRAPNPLVDPALFRGRAFRGASIAMVLFSMAFGAMLLSIVLWMQNAWGWSALHTGLAIAPGPLMVPLFGLLVAGRLIARFGAGAVAGAGAAVFGLGVVWWALAIGVEPDYAGGLLGGMIVTGVGVGLTLPTLMATAAASLPPHAFATGSAVVNTLRQVGLAIGVAILVAILGADPSLESFRDGWWVLAGLSFAASAAGFALLGRPRAAAARAPAAEAS